MTKIKMTEDLKLQTVLTYLNGKEGHRTIAEQAQIDPSALRYWVKLYEYHGAMAFYPREKQNYDASFKLNVLQWLYDQGASIRETAAYFNISNYSVVRKWKQKFEVGGENALKNRYKGHLNMKKQTKQTGSAELSIGELQAELEHLRMENAYLKKLNALVQNKEKSPNKTKRK